MKEKLGLTLQQRTEINLSLCYIYAHTNTRSRCTGSCCERWELICTCACYFTRPQTSVFVICTRDCSDLYLVIHSIDFCNILLTMQPRLRMKGHHSKEVRCARHFKCRTTLHVKIYIHWPAFHNHSAFPSSTCFHLQLSDKVNNKIFWYSFLIPQYLQSYHCNYFLGIIMQWKSGIMTHSVQMTKKHNSSRPKLEHIILSNYENVPSHLFHLPNQCRTQAFV